jgi:hypothetical protein
LSDLSISPKRAFVFAAQSAHNVEILTTSSTFVDGYIKKIKIITYLQLGLTLVAMSYNIDCQVL